MFVVVSDLGSGALTVCGWDPCCRVKAGNECRERGELVRVGLRGGGNGLKWGGKLDPKDLSFESSLSSVPALLSRGRGLGFLDSVGFDELLSRHRTPWDLPRGRLAYPEHDSCSPSSFPATLSSPPSPPPPLPTFLTLPSRPLPFFNPLPLDPASPIPSRP